MSQHRVVATDVVATDTVPLTRLWYALRRGIATHVLHAGPSGPSRHVVP